MAIYHSDYNAPLQYSTVAGKRGKELFYFGSFKSVGGEGCVAPELLRIICVHFPSTHYQELHLTQPWMDAEVAEYVVKPSSVKLQCSAWLQYRYEDFTLMSNIFV